MKAQHRSKLQRLDTILADYARAERIALQRLAEAGFEIPRRQHDIHLRSATPPPANPGASGQV